MPYSSVFGIMLTEQCEYSAGGRRMRHCLISSLEGLKLKLAPRGQSGRSQGIKLAFD